MSLRQRVRAWVGLELSESVDLVLAHEVLGTEYGSHAVCLEGLGPGSVVYSFGVGEDVSFDLGLMERTGAEVFAFDPTPRSVAWVREQALPAGFRMHAFGLAAHDGTLSFAPPANPEHVSHSSVPSGSAGAVEFAVKRLSTVARELGHSRLDVLKMDIEGAEYAVIDDVLAHGPPVDQWLIEFHHGHYGIPVKTTRAAVARLRAAGYGLFRISASGHELSFRRRSRE